MSNLGVLVTHVRTPSPPAVGLRSCVRMRVPCCLFASARRRNSCGSASRRSRGARLPRRRSCRRLRRRALPAGSQMPCCYLHHAVRRGPTYLCEATPRGPRPSSQGDGCCRRAIRPVGAHAGPCTGPEDIAGCVALRKAPDGLFIQARQDGARTSAAQKTLHHHHTSS